MVPEKIRASNAIHLGQGMPFPNNTQPVPRAQAMTLDELCAQHKAFGANGFRIKFCGWNEPQNQDGVMAFEPGGYFSNLDMGPGEYTNWGGRLPELVDACLAHDVRIHVIPFDRVEFVEDAAWHKHPWNTRNGGFLSDPSRVLIDPRAIDFARRRIDGIVEAIGPVISSFEAMAEMTYFWRQDFFNTDWAGLQRIVMDQGVPWVERIAQHIHSVHDAPVGNGNVKNLGTPGEFKNEVYRVPSLDYALLNLYGHEDISVKFPLVRAAEIYTGLPCHGEQAAPWEIGGFDSGYVRDDPPYPRYKSHVWACTCGVHGLCGPMRWPESGERSVGPYETWLGVSHPMMSEVTGITKHLADEVDLRNWNGRGHPYEENVQSDNLAFVAACGEGQHVTAYCNWYSGGTKRTSVAGLIGETCKVTIYDYLTGEPSVTHEDLPILGGRVVFDVPTVDARAAFYVEPPEAAPPQPKQRTIHVRGVLSVDGEEDGFFEGDLEEVL